MRLDRNPAACSNDYFVLISMPSIGFSSLQSPRCKPARNAVIVCVVNTSTLRERPVPARFICVASSMTPSHLQPVDMLLNGSVLVSPGGSAQFCIACSCDHQDGRLDVCPSVLWENQPSMTVAAPMEWPIRMDSLEPHLSKAQRRAAATSINLPR